MYERHYDFMALSGQSALSRQLVENKWSKEQFFSPQNRQHSDKKSAYNKINVT
jgi:hypothetical protein